MSLLEVLTATTLLATLMASSTVVLRSSYAAWQAHEADLERAESAYAVLRHVMRHVRQAETVLAVTPKTDASGSLSLRMPSGDTYVWEHDSGSGEVRFGVDAATALLADNIDSLTFEPLQANAVDDATNPNDAQLIRCEATVAMPHGGGTSRTASCTGWLRSW